jgi:histidinol-phosphate aminotransferase
MYPIYAHAAGATPVAAAETNRTVDVDAILRVCGDRTRLVLLGNPGNPTGTMIPPSKVARLAENLPTQALLVLDGAYAEYVEGFDGGASLVEARDNVVMTRTFSKIHGLGGLRVGWGYGPEHVIDALNRVRGPFNLSGPALAAAEAAIRNTGWTATCRALNAADRATLAATLAELGIASDPSHANFILARFRDRAEAEAADAALRAAGIIVRKVAGYGFPEALRITVGDAAACARVTDTLAAFVRVRA